jgi:mRNA-degrading endonuclease RelE of RelBE toxin-antitoxin system
VRWRVELTGSAGRDLKRLDPQIAKRAADELRALASEFEANEDQARQGYIRKLAGRPGEYRRRMGKHRIVFALDHREIQDDQGQSMSEGMVLVLAIDARSDVYKSK